MRIKYSFFHYKMLIVSLIVGIIAAAALYGLQDYATANPFEDLTYEDTKYCSLDENGNSLIVDKAGTRLLKVSPEGVLQWKREAEGSAFSDIRQVVASKDRIYLHDVKIEEGIRIREESILELDAKGRLKNTVAHYLYSERTLQPHIVGMTPTENGIAYVYKTTDEFRLVLPGVGERSCPMPEAGVFLHRAVYDEASDTIYYDTFNGQIRRYVDGTADPALYTSTAYSDRTIPWDLSYRDGRLYASDIGQRDILVIDTATGELSRISEEEDLLDREVVYSISAFHGLTCASDYTIRGIAEDGTITYETECQTSYSYRCLAVLAKVVIAVLGLLLIYYLLFFLYFLIHQRNFYIRMIAVIVTGALILSGIILAVVIPQFKTAMLDSFFDRAELASTMVCNTLDKDAFRQLDSAEDFMGEDYKKVRRSVTGVFFNQSDSMKDLYCSMYKYIDGMMVLSYGLEDNTGAIYPYDWEYEGSNEEMVLTSKTGITYQSSTAEGEYIFTYDPIIDDDGNAVGIIEVGTDVASFYEEQRKLVMDAFVNTIAVTVVMLLIIVEVIYFIKGCREYREKENVLGVGNVREIPPEVLRMVSFLVFFLTNLPTAFLPIYAMQVSERSSGLSIAPEIMAALPLSAEVITGAVFSVLGVPIVNRIGEKKAMLISSLLFIAGFGVRVVPNIWVLILGNGVLGIGWGVILLVVNMRITDLPEKQKDLGFSQYNVASLNGINCGVVFGGFLVNWMNYQMVFGVSTVLSLLMLWITSKYLSNPGKEGAEEEAGNGFAATIRFLFNPRVLCVLLLIVAPTTICYYFLNYLYPIVGSDYGMSETYIGYSFLVNGLLVMTFGGVLTNFFSREGRKRIGVVTASLIYAGAFGLVVFFQNIPSLLTALALLGVSDSFGLPLQSGYYTDLKAVEKFGAGPALGVYNLVVNVAQTVGPFVFSYVLLVGIAPGLGAVLAALVCTALLFFAIEFILDRAGKTGRIKG